MRSHLVTLAAAALAIAGTVPAEAQGNSANAPGQDRTCLIETSTPGSFDDVDVVSAKWLPRKAAEEQASKDPERLRTFEYVEDPLVTGGTYSSAEELCKNHFD